MAALSGAFTAGSLRGPLETAVGCAAVLLAEGLALLALVPENPRARMAARAALVIGTLALVLAVVVGIGYWRLTIDPGLTRRHAGAYQVAVICATAGGWLLAVLTVASLIWGALAVVAPSPSDTAASSSGSSGTGAPGLGGPQPFFQRPMSGWGTRRVALAQARLWLWPWLDAYATLCVISLVVAAIRIEHTSGPAPLSADALIVSVGGTVVWSLLIGTISYRQMTLSRGLVVGVLAVASLLTLAQIGVDVVRIMTF